MKMKVLHAMVKEMGSQMGGYATKHLKDKYGSLPFAPHGEAHEEPQAHSYSDEGGKVLHDTDHDGDDDLYGMPKTEHPESIMSGDHQTEEEMETDGEEPDAVEVPRAKDKAKKTKKPPRW